MSHLSCYNRRAGDLWVHSRPHQCNNVLMYYLCVCTPHMTAHILLWETAHSKHINDGSQWNAAFWFLKFGRNSNSTKMHSKASLACPNKIIHVSISQSELWCLDFWTLEPKFYQMEFPHMDGKSKKTRTFSRAGDFPDTPFHYVVWKAAEKLLWPLTAVAGSSSVASVWAVAVECTPWLHTSASMFTVAGRTPEGMNTDKHTQEGKNKFGPINSEKFEKETHASVK